MMKKVPLILQNIKGIPTGVVNNHNEAFYYWWKFEIEDATLLHVDARYGR